MRSPAEYKPTAIDGKYQFTLTLRPELHDAMMLEVKKSGKNRSDYLRGLIWEEVVKSKSILPGSKPTESGGKI